MGWLISALGLVLALGGAASLAYGATYIRLDWGAAEVIAGTVALSGGLVTLSLGAVLFALRGQEAPRAARDRPAARLPSRPGAIGLAEPSLAPMPDSLAVPEEAATDPLPVGHEAGLAPAEPGPVLPVEAPTVVGRYEANGASYVLFSDGTIEVETETGTHRFASMADLKLHIDRQEPG